jgi:AcrR family transcriptional regulator
MGGRLKGDERRRVIIDAALALFARKGFRGTTTKETIFKYFTSKDELYSAILEVKSAIEETMARAAEAAAKNDDAGVFRAVGLEALIRTEQDPSLMRLLLYSALEGHELSHFFFESKVRHLHEFLSNYIEQRVTDGMFRPVNPLLAARGFVGMIVHYLLIHEIFGVKRPAGILPEEVVETFVTLFVTGIRR